MPVYVDTMKAPLGRMLMSHMVADTTEELQAMADKIGVARKWLQKAGTHAEHYDICQTKVRLAILNGARIVTGREIAMMIRQKREPVTA